MKNSWNIQLQQLSIGYSNNIVLQEMNTTIPAGKISVILGGSGCGKSTLLRHIIGLSRPISGNIIINDMDIFSVPNKTFRRIRRRMGVLFQDGALLGSLTVGENVGLPLREHTSLSDQIIHKVVAHKLSLVGLSHAINYYPNELSGGMRKRAGLARAMVTDPPILLCDEPTSGLDPISASQMDSLLLSMKSRFPEMTIIVVSHDMESVKSIADNVIVLQNKKIIYDGSLENIYATDNPYLKDFLNRKVPRADQNTEESNSLSKEIIDQVNASLDGWLEKL